MILCAGGLGRFGLGSWPDPIALVSDVIRDNVMTSRAPRARTMSPGARSHPGSTHCTHRGLRPAGGLDDHVVVQNMDDASGRRVTFLDHDGWCCGLGDLTLGSRAFELPASGMAPGLPVSAGGGLAVGPAGGPERGPAGG
jgi:hypothetical protein